MKENLICSFFGHRSITLTKELYAATAAEILKSVDFGCRTFYFGGYGEFGSLCYKNDKEIKEEKDNSWHKACLLRCTRIPSKKKARYFNPEDYDELIYLIPSFEYWYTSIYYRNLAMIGKSDYIIFYAENNKNSESCKAYKYALRKRKNKRIVNLVETRS